MLFPYRRHRPIAQAADLYTKRTPESGLTRGDGLS